MVIQHLDYLKYKASDLKYLSSPVIYFSRCVAYCFHFHISKWRSCSATDPLQLTITLKDLFVPKFRLPAGDVFFRKKFEIEIGNRVVEIKIWSYVVINFRMIRGEESGLDAPHASDGETSCAHPHGEIKNLHVIFVYIRYFSYLNIVPHIL